MTNNNLEYETSQEKAYALDTLVEKGLNQSSPFSESHNTDRPAFLNAATKKAEVDIGHAYKNIYALSSTGLRFFTVIGPMGRRDMSFNKSILAKKSITIFHSADGRAVICCFTYIDGVVKGCLGALDTAKRSTGVNT
ncbi:hypothetical protein HPP92_009944 [Vanilla planifolia]|uniref:Uncharacterized protein n=1 Tax=Vanilla planifolia TaxID=51239 RepID=A0A835RD99_VANPL|nr:hypothetical protein HPP92_009944 [Vanilla planifolia]